MIYDWKDAAVMPQGLKGELIVAKKLVVSDFLLVVNGDWAGSKNFDKTARFITENVYKLKVIYTYILYLLTLSQFTTGI